VALDVGVWVALVSPAAGASGSGVAAAGDASGVGAGVLTVAGAGSVVGVSCAHSGVEENAKTAAIAVAPVRAYSVFMFFIMTNQPANGPIGRT
jgi:hypothetical protein